MLIDRIPFCEHGRRDKISIELLKKLAELEDGLGIELHYNSGYRCAECNRKAGGVPNSAHLRGYAVDMACPDGSLRFNIIKTAINLNFKRIGAGKNFIHLDIDEDLPQRVLWVY